MNSYQFKFKPDKIKYLTNISTLDSSHTKICEDLIKKRENLPKKELKLDKLKKKLNEMNNNNNTIDDNFIINQFFYIILKLLYIFKNFYKYIKYRRGRYQHNLYKKYQF